MKRVNLCIFLFSSILFFLIPHNINAQKKYYTWIELIDGKHLNKGYLIGIDANQIDFLNKRDLKKWRAFHSISKMEWPASDYSDEKLNRLLVNITIQNVHSIKFKKITKFLSSTGWGALIGGTTGAVIFTHAYDGEDFLFSKSDYTAAGGLLGGILGALIGKLLDAPKIKFYIGGKQDLFLNNRDRIVSFVYKIS